MFRMPGSPAYGKNSLKRNAWNSVPRSHGKAGFVVAGLHAGHRVLVRSHLFAVLGLHVVMRTAGSSSFRVSGAHLVAARPLRLVGGNRALLRVGRSARGCALGPRH